jgi:hypothetical protein
MKLKSESASRIITEIVVMLLLYKENGLNIEPEKVIRINIVQKETH